MQDHTISLLRLVRRRLAIAYLAFLTNRRRILTVMATVQRTHQLCEDCPNELLIRIHLPGLQAFDVTSKIAVATILHIQMQIILAFQVVSAVVLHDVGVSQGFQYLELGV
jgi:hypothetical protein